MAIFVRGLTIGTSNSHRSVSPEAESASFSEAEWKQKLIAVGKFVTPEGLIIGNAIPACQMLPLLSSSERTARTQISLPQIIETANNPFDDRMSASWLYDIPIGLSDFKTFEDPIEGNMVVVYQRRYKAKGSDAFVVPASTYQGILQTTPTSTESGRLSEKAFMEEVKTRVIQATRRQIDGELSIATQLNELVTEYRDPNQTPEAIYWSELRKLRDKSIGIITGDKSLSTPEIINSVGQYCYFLDLAIKLGLVNDEIFNIYLGAFNRAVAESGKYANALPQQVQKVLTEAIVLLTENISCRVIPYLINARGLLLTNEHHYSLAAKQIISPEMISDHKLETEAIFARIIEDFGTIKATVEAPAPTTRSRNLYSEHLEPENAKELNRKTRILLRVKFPETVSRRVKQLISPTIGSLRNLVPAENRAKSIEENTHRSTCYHTHNIARAINLIATSNPNDQMVIDLIRDIQAYDRQMQDLIRPSKPQELRLQEIGDRSFYIENHMAAVLAEPNTTYPPQVLTVVRPVLARLILDTNRQITKAVFEHNVQQLMTNLNIIMAEAVAQEKEVQEVVITAERLSNPFNFSNPELQLDASQLLKVGDTAGATIGREATPFVDYLFAEGGYRSLLTIIKEITEETVSSSIQEIREFVMSNINTETESLETLARLTVKGALTKISIPVKIGLITLLAQIERQKQRSMRTLLAEIDLTSEKQADPTYAIFEMLKKGFEDGISITLYDLISNPYSSKLRSLRPRALEDAIQNECKPLYGRVVLPALNAPLSRDDREKELMKSVLGFLTPIMVRELCLALIAEAERISMNRFTPAELLRQVRDAHEAYLEQMKRYNQMLQLFGSAI